MLDRMESTDQQNMSLFVILAVYAAVALATVTYMLWCTWVHRDFSAYWYLVLSPVLLPCIIYILVTCLLMYLGGLVYTWVWPREAGDRSSQSSEEVEHQGSPTQKE